MESRSILFSLTQRSAPAVANAYRAYRTIERRQSRQIMVGQVPVGGDAPISVQTMTNTLLSLIHI